MARPCRSHQLGLDCPGITPGSSRCTAAADGQPERWAGAESCSLVLYCPRGQSACGEGRWPECDQPGSAQLHEFWPAENLCLAQGHSSTSCPAGSHGCTPFPAWLMVHPGSPRSRIQLRWAFKGRVLVIDDEPVSLFALKRRMESAGWLVHAMVSAAEAIAQVEAGETYTVIIVDSRMPEMSGFDFCRRIRPVRQGSPAGSLMLDSGHSSVIDHAFRSGANDYLIRPVGGMSLKPG
jgi:CheY-like chemotaxis protein